MVVYGDSLVVIS
jgi:hypothetical protein